MVIQILHAKISHNHSHMFVVVIYKNDINSITWHRITNQWRQFMEWPSLTKTELSQCEHLIWFESVSSIIRQVFNCIYCCLCPGYKSLSDRWMICAVGMPYLRIKLRSYLHDHLSAMPLHQRSKKMRIRLKLVIILSCDNIRSNFYRKY